MECKKLEKNRITNKFDRKNGILFINGDNLMRSSKNQIVNDVLGIAKLVDAHFIQHLHQYHTILIIKKIDDKCNT